MPREVKDHPQYNETWEMDDMQIEDRIKELRKEIYKLQTCRKKQPKLCVFRLSKHRTGPEEAHIFDGFQVVDLSKGLFCADSWHPIRQKEADAINKKYELTEKGKDIVKKTVKKYKNVN